MLQLASKEFKGPRGASLGWFRHLSRLCLRPVLQGNVIFLIRTRRFPTDPRAHSSISSSSEWHAVREAMVSLDGPIDPLLQELEGDRQGRQRRHRLRGGQELMVPHQVRQVRQQGHHGEAVGEHVRHPQLQHEALRVGRHTQLEGRREGVLRRFLASCGPSEGTSGHRNGIETGGLSAPKAGNRAKWAANGLSFTLVIN